MPECPLCFRKESFTDLTGPDKRIYRKCAHCQLIFSEDQYLPSLEVETDRYVRHNNGLHHPGYVRFLNQAIEPGLSYLKKGMEGLDFGCGPVPTLSVLVKEQGFACDDYDPIFFPDLPDKKYDFIFATECFEHFFSPAAELEVLKNHLKPGGYLIVMTEPWISIDVFHKWYYATDRTHVTFFHRKTFDYIALKYEFELIETGNKRMTLFRNKTM
jgi:SAM-dependent methyltransferase